MKSIPHFIACLPAGKFFEQRVLTVYVTRSYCTRSSVKVMLVTIWGPIFRET